MLLRSYQSSLFNQIIQSDLNDLAQLDTGAGKTPIISRLAEHYEYAVIVCHRNILIKQASEKLAMCGLQHRIIASRETKRICASNNIAKVGAHFINPRATIELVSIDTIYSRLKKGEALINPKVKILLVDEAHHLADDNKWALLAEQLKVRCVGFTATPCRGDGFPMIKRFGGFFDRIIQADGYETNATERLISEGYLAEYSAYLAQNDSTSINSRGMSDNKEIWLAHSSLYAYEEYGKGKQAIVIESRISNAIDATSYFNKFGIKASVIHSQLPQYEIERILQAFESKQIRVLVAVDMINEGFDVPDADVLILSRVVNSFGLYRQLCGRVLRPRKGKHALILDLNGESIAKHGLPSDHVDWNARQATTKRQNLTVCAECKVFFKATLTACPECGAENKIERNLQGMAHLEKKFFDAKMVERERSKIAYAEAERLRSIERQKELEQDALIYRQYTAKFQSGILGKRCQHIFETLQTELQHILEPYDFNQFFKMNSSKFGNIDFYAGIVDASFDKNKTSQCKRLYEKHR